MANAELHDMDLRWFFSVGQSMFEKSAFGNMLARQLNYTRDEKGQRIPHPKEQENEVWAHRQRGCWMQTSVIDQELADLARDPDLRDVLDPDPSLTARHNGAPPPTIPVIPDEENLQRHARVSGRLSRIGRTNLEVLELWYGNRGAYWQERGGSPIFGLLPYTKMGKRILQQHADKLGDHRADEILWQQCKDQETGLGKDTQRGLMLASARNDARALFATAFKSYTKAT